MLSDEFPEYGGKAPQTLGGSPVSIHLYVDDVDAFFKQALAAGAKELKAVMDQFYGDRSGQLEDPFGDLWWVATHKEDVAPEEMQKRIQALFAGKKSGTLGIGSRLFAPKRGCAWFTVMMAAQSKCLTTLSSLSWSSL
jgi:PhnB protein